MQLQFLMAALLSASVFVLPAFASEMSDEKKTRHAKCQPYSFEPLVDIHASAAVVQHPTQSVSNAASIAELIALREQGEARDSKLRAEYQTRGKVFPEHFPGD
jgi:hypothetical protein